MPDDIYPRDTAIIHRSELEAVKFLLKTSPEQAKDLAVSILEYKLDGKYNRGADFVVDSNMTTIIQLSDNEAKRWAKAEENGSKGGRPKNDVSPSEAYNYVKIEGHKQQAAADHFGVHLRTIQRRLQQYNEMSKQEMKTEIENLNKIEETLAEVDSPIDETAKPQTIQCGGFVF